MIANCVVIFLLHSTHAFDILHISCILFGCGLQSSVKTDTYTILFAKCILSGLWHFLVILDVVSVCHARIKSFICLFSMCDHSGFDLINLFA